MSEMTPRERWRTVLDHERPDRIPMDYWATSEATAKLMAHLGCGSAEEMFARLHIDKVVTVGPKYVGPPLPAGVDAFGCRHQKVDYGTGAYSEVVGHPLAEFETVEAIEANYTWPSPEWYDYSHIPAVAAANESHPIRGGGSEPFLTYKSLRGQQLGTMDLALNPEIVHYCLDKLFDLAYEKTCRIYEQVPVRVMISYVAEDFGSQAGLMYSPEQIREFFIPRMKRMIDLAHQAGAFVFFHSDGGVRKIIPDMIAAGIDVLNPVQWKCRGMAREGLKRDFGEQLVFHGGVDNQYTLPFGTVEEVREEVEDNIRLLGPEGYILAPCHNIQSVGPAENIVAMYETGYQCGRL